MPKQNKIDAVAEITADLKAADIYYFVDYRGLTSAEADAELRARLRKVDAISKSSEHLGRSPLPTPARRV